MSRACLKFLSDQVAKGGDNAYAAMLILGAIEGNRKDLLKKFDMETLRENLEERRRLQYSNVILFSKTTSA